MDKVVDFDFNFSQQEIKILKSTWASLKIVDTLSSSHSTFQDMQFNVSYVQRFHAKLTDFINKSGAAKTDTANLNWQIDSLIQIISLSIINLLKSSSHDPTYLNHVTKFAHKSTRLYNVNLEVFGECLILALESLLPAFNSINQIVFLRFLNKLFNLFNTIGADDEVHDQAASTPGGRSSTASSSFSSSLSLVMDDVSSSATEQKSLPNPVTASPPSTDSSVDTTKQIPTQAQQTIIPLIDEAEYDSDGDDAFDYLNSFTAVTPKTQLLVKTRSAIKANNKGNRLRRISSSLSSTRVQETNNKKKQDCVIV